MPMPKSVIKVNKKGVQYVSNVDRVKYTLAELTRAALKDVAKFLRKLIIWELQNLPGMKRNRRLYNSTQYWVRKKETDLQIGFKHDSWYGILQEFGTRAMKQLGILRKVVYNNINEIRRIEGVYLSAIEDENRAKGLIDEAEEVGDDVGA